MMLSGCHNIFTGNRLIQGGKDDTLVSDEPINHNTDINDETDSIND